jgi:outer membrane protein
MFPSSSLLEILRAARSAGMLVLGAALNLLVASAADSSPRTITVAVVQDGHSSMVDNLEAAFRVEAQAITAGRARLSFKNSSTFDAGWRQEAASAALDAALADPSIDYVLALGVRVSAAAGAPGRKLAKPVLGALLQESDLAPLPIGADGRSQRENFAVATLPSRATDQLTELRRVVPFTSLHILVDEFFATDLARLATWRDQLASALGVPVMLVPLGVSADETLAALGKDPHVVMLFPAVRMDRANRAALLERLSARKFRVLSYAGETEVEAGALAGVLPDPRAALARRLAINLDQLIAGTPATELPLHVSLPRQLFYNETTAASIGFAANFERLSQATFIGQFSATAGQPLSFTEAVTTALERNFSYRARQSATEASHEAARMATGALLPQLAATQSFQQIDRDRASASGGAQPQASFRAGVGLTQVVVDDESFTRRRIAREAHRAATYEEQVERLDTVNAAGQGYLQLLSAQASLRVAEENFKVTQRNLEFARLRQRVGTSGPEEAYRFESLAAQQRSELAAAHTQSDQARVALNRVLAVAADTRWDAQDLTLDDPAFEFTTGRVMALVSDRGQLERFRSFTAAYAAAHSPDLAALEQNVKTLRLTAEQKQRRPHTPKVSASIDYGRTLRQSFAGPSLAEQFAGAGIPVQSSTPDRNTWTVGVSGSLPLFTGGSVRADARKARAELRQIELTRDGARAGVIAQTQSALYGAESAYANIRLSRRAAELASQNLDVVQDKYERGTVSIVTLLDAQNSAFSQRQAAEAATYRFFSELLRFHRSLGWIEALATPAEKEAWFAEMEGSISR